MYSINWLWRFMPKISVISIAKNDRDLDKLKYYLSRQTFKDFEFVYSNKGSIPEAWNDAISKANGQLFVFTESDAMPLRNDWLEEINTHIWKNRIIKGLEINPTSLDMCNLAGDGKIFRNIKFDEEFQVAEDTELFARLKKTGIPIEQLNAFPVIHAPTYSWRKTVSRSFLYGLLMTKILYLHGEKNLDNVNTTNIQTSHMNPISNRIRIILENVLFLAGLTLGAIIYIPIYLRKLIHL
jgi:hypothetical protein